MKDKLAVGVYVRTKQGKIGKIIDINLGQEEKRYILDSSSVYIYYETDILKASHNIIDLIEVGDYVNWLPVRFVEENRVDIGQEENYLWLKNEHIKSIVTKEQFESIKYSLEG